MKDKILISAIFILLCIITALAIRTYKQDWQIENNNSLIKDYEQSIDSLLAEQIRKEKLLQVGKAKEDSLELAISKTDSFNLVTLKKIKRYAKTDFSHLSSDSQTILLSERAKRFRSNH